MMKSWLAGLFCLGIAVPVASLANQDPATSMQSSVDDFREFSRVMQGRWISEIIWITDWPGFGERGDTATGYAEYQIAEDGNVLTGREYQGGGSITSVAYYDPGERQIVQHWVASSGGAMHFIYYKQNGEWHYNLLGTTVDEEEIAGSGIRYIEDQGQTQRFTGEWSIDGEMLDPLRDSFRRLGD
jgi:hypothetical protein